MASVRFDTPSLARIRLTWSSTVRGLITSRSAIWRLRSPSATSPRTWTSRRVSGPADLTALVQQAGFDDVRTAITVAPTRFPGAEAFLRAETASSPLGDVVDALDDDVVEALISDLTDALRPHADSDGVCFPFETVTVTASGA